METADHRIEPLLHLARSQSQNAQKDTPTSNCQQLLQDTNVYWVKMENEWLVMAGERANNNRRLGLGISPVQLNLRDQKQGPQYHQGVT